MLRPDILRSAFAISVFLIIYYLAVGFFPVFFETVFGYSQSKANALGNYFWAFDAAALLIVGSSRTGCASASRSWSLGAVCAIVFTTIFALKATHPETSYTTFVDPALLHRGVAGTAFAPWMASFTETVERRNPALIATGLAVWGLIIRVVIAVTVFFVPKVVTTATHARPAGAGGQGGARRSGAGRPHDDRQGRHRGLREPGDRRAAAGDRAATRCSALQPPSPPVRCQQAAGDAEAALAASRLGTRSRS